MGLQISGLLLLFCFFFIEMKGSEVKQLFVLTGSDVTLDIINPDVLEDYVVLHWKFNTSVLVSARQNGKVTNNTKRVVYHSQNFSLTVKNLKEEHSGLYQAVLITDTGISTIARYSITVEAPVSPVNLSVVSWFNSSVSCNVTVSCTTESSSIIAFFTCNRHTCEEPRPFTPDPAPSLRLYLLDASVICNHSNHVSWKNDTKDVKQMCPVFGSKDPIEETEMYLIPVVCVTFGILLVLLILAAVLCRRRQKSQRMEVENTIYSTPERPFPKPVPASEPLLEDPTSTYSLVGPHSAPVPQSSDTLYSTVNKPESNSHSQSAA